MKMLKNKFLYNWYNYLNKRRKTLSYSKKSLAERTISNCITPLEQLEDQLGRLEGTRLKNWWIEFLDEILMFFNPLKWYYMTKFELQISFKRSQILLNSKNIVFFMKILFFDNFCVIFRDFLRWFEGRCVSTTTFSNTEKFTKKCASGRLSCAFKSS